METLFILLHGHHWHNETKEIDWTVGIPVYVAASLFLLNLLREYVIKRRDTKKLLSNHLIETCDKMIRLTPIAFCGLAKVAIFTTNAHTKCTLQIYENLSYEARNRHFCQTAVSRCPYFCLKRCLFNFAVRPCDGKINL